MSGYGSYGRTMKINILVVTIAVASCGIQPPAGGVSPFGECPTESSENVYACVLHGQDSDYKGGYLPPYTFQFLHYSEATSPIVAEDEVRVVLALAGVRVLELKCIAGATPPDLALECVQDTVVQVGAGGSSGFGGSDVGTGQGGSSDIGTGVGASAVGGVGAGGGGDERR